MSIYPSYLSIIPIYHIYHVYLSIIIPLNIHNTHTYSYVHKHYSSSSGDDSFLNNDCLNNEYYIYCYIYLYTSLIHITTSVFYHIYLSIISIYHIYLSFLSIISIFHHIYLSYLSIYHFYLSYLSVYLSYPSFIIFIHITTAVFYPYYYIISIYLLCIYHIYIQRYSQCKDLVVYYQLLLLSHV